MQEFELFWLRVLCVTTAFFEKNSMFKLFPAGGVLFTQAGFLIFYSPNWDLWLCIKFIANLDVPDSDLDLQSLPFSNCCIKVSQAGNCKNLKIHEDLKKLPIFFYQSNVQRKFFKTDKYQMNRRSRAIFSATWKSLNFRGILMASGTRTGHFSFCQIFRKPKFFGKF